MSEQKKSYYAVIPAFVRYDNALTLGARMLYGELTALSNQEGFCWASNGYFADLYAVSKDTISDWISQLQKRGHVSIKTANDGGFTRNIYITKTDTPLGKNTEAPRGNHLGPLGKKPVHNTTVNTTEKTADAPRRIPEASEEDRSVEEVDPESGEPVRRKVAQPKRERKNEVAMRILKKFGAICKKEIGTTPIESTSGYLMVLRAINRGKLSEQQIYDLLDEWITSGKPDEEVVQITRALSDNQINAFKARNQIRD